MKLTVPALKDLARRAGLKVGGTKSELIARLETAAKPEPQTPASSAITERRTRSTLPPLITQLGEARLICDEDLLPENSDDPVPDYEDSLSRFESEAQGIPLKASLKSFGPLGHDYMRNQRDESELHGITIDRVNQLLAERLRAKLSRQFEQADDIRDILGSFGIIVHDGFKEWRADGVPFEVDAPINSHIFLRIGGYAGDVDEAMVHRCIAERGTAKRIGDFVGADEIRDKLLRKYNVEVNDRARSWLLLTPAGHPYTPLDRSTSLVAEIEELLLQRYLAKRSSNFAEADMHQIKLRALGVEVDDANLNWRFCV